MKKLLIILPCVIALFGCDKIKFNETDIECIKPSLQPEETTFIHYDSWKLDSEKAILRTQDKEITLKRYMSEKLPDFILYKNENTDEVPLFLHYSKNIYGIGMSEDNLSPCHKVSK